MHSLHNKLRGHDVNLVGKCKQVHVLIDYSVSLLVYITKDMTQFTRPRLLTSNKPTTGFIREYLPLVSYYFQAQKCTTEVTCDYLQLICNLSRAVYSSSSTSPTHELSSWHGGLHTFFVNLDMSCTIKLIMGVFNPFTLTLYLE